MTCKVGGAEWEPSFSTCDPSIQEVILRDIDPRTGREQMDLGEADGLRAAGGQLERRERPPSTVPFLPSVLQKPTQECVPFNPSLSHFALLALASPQHRCRTLC